MKRPMGEGNGSGKFVVFQVDMGGWVRVYATGNQPPDLGVYLSHSLGEWFRKHAHYTMRCVVPIQADGATTELHAWYDGHLFGVIQGPQPLPDKKPE